MDSKSEKTGALLLKIEKLFSRQPKDTHLKRLAFYFVFGETIGKVRNEFLAGVGENDVERVEISLKKLQPFFCVSEWDSLKRAVDSVSRDVLRLLLDFNFRINKSLIDYAIRFNKYEEAEILLTGVSFSGNGHDAKFLWTATAEGKLRFIRKAVEKGANSRRAMMCALLFKRKDIVLFLLSCGSDVRGWTWHHSRLLSYLIADNCCSTAYLEGIDGSEDSFQMADEEKLFHYEYILSNCKSLVFNTPFSNLTNEMTSNFNGPEGFNKVPVRLRSLKDVCRASIRKMISQASLPRPAYVTIDMLPIPTSVKYYLRYKEYAIG